MRITPSSIHDKNAGVLAHGFRKCLGPFLHNNVTPANLTGNASVERGTIRVIPVNELRDNDVIFEPGFALRT